MKHRAGTIVVAMAMLATAGCGTAHGRQASTPTQTKATGAPAAAPGCGHVDPTKWKVVPTKTALLKEVKAGTIPRPSAVSQAPTAPSVLHEYATLDEFSKLIGGNQTELAVLKAGGFKASNNATFRSNGVEFAVYVFEFRDAAAATDETKTTIEQSCGDKGSDPQPDAWRSSFYDERGGMFATIPTQPDGVAFATFVIGQYEVEISVCGCVDSVRDVLYDWYGAWLDTYATGDPSSVH